MSLPDQVIDAMVDAGCTAAQIAAAVKASNALQPQRSSNAERQARYRASKKASQRNEVTPSVTRDVTDNATPPFPPSLDKEIPPTPPKEINLSPPLPPHSPPAQARKQPPIDAFEQFWEQYPNKVRISSARQSLMFAMLKADFDQIMDGVRRYAAKTDDKPWMNPSTWLSDECWNDQPATPPPRQARSITAGEAKRQERDDAYNNWIKQDDAPNDITEPQGRVAALIEGAVNRG